MPMPAPVNESAQTKLPLQRDFDDVRLLLLATALGTLVPVAGVVDLGDIAGSPSAATAWLAYACTTAALVLFLAHDPETPLRRVWQGLWTASFVTFLIQPWSSADPTHAFLNATPVPLFGAYAGNWLLAALWGLSVVLAWARPNVTWPHAVLFIVLGGGLLRTSAIFGPWLARGCAALFLAALVGAAVLRYRRLISAIAKLDRQRAHKPEPLPPTVTSALILQQVWRDAHGKEVASAATYSYLWLADQVGHVGVGMVLSLVLTGGAGALTGWWFPSCDAPAGTVLAFPSWCGGVPQLAGWLAATLIVCHWELNAYRGAVAPHPGPFQPDRLLIRRNAVVAALYMVIGASTGWAFLLPFKWAIPVLIALAFIGVVSAKYWVRQKIIWQKAGLPYLFRLSDAFHSGIETAAAALQEIIKELAPPETPARQVVIAGPLGSGRTKLASGVGTEFAFCDKTVRYVSLDRLIEFADTPGATSDPPRYADDLGPSNIGYWPWTQAQVLIIDDIGPVLGRRAADSQLPGGPYSEHLAELLERELRPLRGCLRDRHTVWILGDLGKGDAASEALAEVAQRIRAFCEGTENPTPILLPDAASPRPGRPARRRPRR